MAGAGDELDDDIPWEVSRSIGRIIEMMNAGHPLRYTKGNKQLGRQRRPVLRTKEDVAILRRAAAGFVLVTMIEGELR